MAEEADPAGKAPDESGLDEIAARAREGKESSEEGLMARSALVERPRFYTYNNLRAPEEDAKCSCGHACIASLHDFFGRISLPPNLRTVRGEGQADDGKLHFQNDFLVRKVFEAYPPENWFGLGFRFTTRETIRCAMADVGLSTTESMPPLFGSETERFALAKSWLMNALAKTRLPVVTLVDLKKLDSEDFHWGMVYAANDQDVWMASWHRVYRYDWKTFAEAWHCRSLPYPNNFYAIYVG